MKSIKSHGEHGGPLCCIITKYEDGTEKQYGHEVLENLMKQITQLQAENAALKAPLTTLCERSRQRDVLAEVLKKMAGWSGCDPAHCNKPACEIYPCHVIKARQALKDAGMEET